MSDNSSVAGTYTHTTIVNGTPAGGQQAYKVPDYDKLLAQVQQNQLLNNPFYNQMLGVPFYGNNPYSACEKCSLEAKQNMERTLYGEVRTNGQGIIHANSCSKRMDEMIEEMRQLRETIEKVSEYGKLDAAKLQAYTKADVDVAAAVDKILAESEPKVEEAEVPPLDPPDPPDEEEEEAELCLVCEDEDCGVCEECDEAECECECCPHCDNSDCEREEDCEHWKCQCDCCNNCGLDPCECCEDCGALAEDCSYCDDCEKSGCRCTPCGDCDEHCAEKCDNCGERGCTCPKCDMCDERACVCSMCPDCDDHDCLICGKCDKRRCLNCDCCQACGDNDCSKCEECELFDCECSCEDEEELTVDIYGPQGADKVKAIPNNPNCEACMGMELAGASQGKHNFMTVHKTDVPNAYLATCNQCHAFWIQDKTGWTRAEFVKEGSAGESNSTSLIAAATKALSIGGKGGVSTMAALGMGAAAGALTWSLAPRIRQMLPALVASGMLPEPAKELIESPLGQIVINIAGKQVAAAPEPEVEEAVESEEQQLFDKDGNPVIIAKSVKKPQPKPAA